MCRRNDKRAKKKCARSSKLNAIARASHAKFETRAAGNSTSATFINTTCDASGRQCTPGGHDGALAPHKIATRRDHMMNVMYARTKRRSSEMAFETRHSTTCMLSNRFVYFVLCKSAISFYALQWPSHSNLILRTLLFYDNC